MTTKEPADDASATDPPVSWRELAVRRSVGPARLRAERRVQRFLDAALELTSDDSSRDFTIQEVAERSGQSPRSFYQYFTGKHELMLALFEELVRSTAERLGELTAEEDDALERLRRFTVEYHRLCRPAPRGKPSRNKRRPTRAMAEFAQRLLAERPKEAARAYLPLVSAFERVLDDAAAAGYIRPHLDHRLIAGLALQAISFNAFSATISGVAVHTERDNGSEELWGLILHGIATDTPG